MAGPKSTRSPKRTRRSQKRRSIANIEALHLLRALGLVDLARLIKSASVASGRKVQSQVKVTKRSINANLEVALEMSLLLIISTERDTWMILVTDEEGTIQEIADQTARGIPIVTGPTLETREGKTIVAMTHKETKRPRTWALTCKSTERRPGSSPRVRVSEGISISL